MKKEKPVKRLEIKESLYLYVEANNVFNCSLEQCAKNILNLKNILSERNEMIKQNPNKFDHYEIQLDSKYNSSSCEIKLFGVRKETDEEYERRKVLVLKNKKAQKEFVKKRRENNKKRELATYLRLQKKFAK